jgi:hypothetical protein
LGAPPSGGDDGGSDAGKDATFGFDGGGPASDGRASGDDASPDDAAQPVDGGVAGDGPAAPCPDVSGPYAISVVEGQGCGDLRASAPECIRQQAGQCDITFRSQSAVGAAAINGNAALQTDGSFTGAALKEGTGNRTGCTGSWDAATSTMTVDCGGMGSLQACVLALKRGAGVCL